MYIYFVPDTKLSNYELLTSPKYSNFNQILCNFGNVLIQL